MFFTGKINKSMNTFINKPIDFQRGETDLDVWGFLGIVIIILLIVLWLCGFNFWQTSKGYVNDADCANTITLEQGDWETYFGKFICHDYSYGEGKGVCEKAKIKNGKCETYYYYEF